jgi:cytochrome c556
MKRGIVIAGLVLALGAAHATSVWAQAKPEVLVKQRQAAMTLIGKYWGPLGAMAQGKAPYNAEIVQRNAAFLDVLSKMPWDGFHPSTKNEKSAALPAVFSEPAKFKEAQDRLQSEIGKLVSVSKNGDEAAVKAQLAAVGKACSNCHENFREKR